MLLLTCSCCFQRQSSSRSGGFSLVELLVAVFLTLILGLAASQSYLLNKSTFRATQEVSKVQQNLRFASHFINKELRQAGNLGCFQGVRSHLDFDQADLDEKAGMIAMYDISQPVNVWQYKPSDSSFDLSSEEAYTTPDSSASSWLDSVGRVRPSVLAGRVMAGSDILLITKISEPIDMLLADNNSPAASTITLQPGSIRDFFDGQVVLVGDCVASDMFVHAGVDADVLEYTISSDYTPRNKPFTLWKRGWQSAHELRVLESTLYYIGQGASGLPALFSIDVGAGIGDDAVHEEVVDGVELLKISLGTDVDNDRRVDRYQFVDTVSAFDKILGVQVGLLSVSDSFGTDDELLEKEYEVLPGFIVQSPDFWNGRPDKRLRYLSSNAVHLKNTGLSRTAELTYK